MEENTKESLEIRRWILRILLFLYDGFVVNFSFFMAIIIRFYIQHIFYDSGEQYLQMFWKFAPYYTVCSLAIFLIFRLYSSVWRYAGMNDIRRIFLANICTVVVQVVGTLIVIERMPISYYVIGAFLQIFLMSVPRIAPRLIIDSFRAISSRKNDLTLPLMIVGVGENTRIIQSKVIEDESNIARPVCVVDFGGGFGGSTFNGLPVVSGLDGMQAAIEKYSVKCMILSDENIPEGALDSIHQICEKNDIELRSFAIKVDYRDGGMSLKDLLSRTNGPVRIVCKDSGTRSASSTTGQSGNTAPGHGASPASEKNGTTGEKEELFSTGAVALKKYRFNYAVESISADPDAMRINVRKIRTAHISGNEDWMEKYREENGGELSFFV